MQSTALTNIAYNPFGFTPDIPASKLAYTGEISDSLTQTYHLGNGYRCYHPALHRFMCPDSWSPFGAGGINSDMYCGADPVNNSDPSGHIQIKSLPRRIPQSTSRRMYLGMKIKAASAEQAKWARVTANVKQEKRVQRRGFTDGRLHNNVKVKFHQATILRLEGQTVDYANLDKSVLESIYRGTGPDTLDIIASNAQQAAINKAFSTRSLLTKDPTQAYKIIKTDNTQSLFSGHYSAAYIHNETKYKILSGGAYSRKAKIADLRQKQYELMFRSTPMNQISSYLSESDLKHGAWNIRNG